MHRRYLRKPGPSVPSSPVAATEPKRMPLKSCTTTMLSVSSVLRCRQSKRGTKSRQLQWSQDRWEWTIASRG